MAATELLANLVGINSAQLSKEEVLIIEAELFTAVCEVLKEFFRVQNQAYFKLMRFSIEKENAMLEANFVRLVIKDILATGEYSLSGVACYTDTHEDVIHEVIDGRNTNPSATLLRRCIDLHRTVRRELYQAIMKKIAVEYMAAAA